MAVQKLQTLLGNIDIYLLDQILKERYTETDKILDAGCGSGRNLHWFYNNGFDLYGVDKETESIEYVKDLYPKWGNKMNVCSLDTLKFDANYFDHIICSAVLHFASNTSHFKAMFSELIRVLKPFGTIFIRMTSNIGIEDKINSIHDGVYTLGDESHRFLLTRDLLSELMIKHSLSFLEPLKSTNVHDLRSMTTLVLQKNPAS
ncbi:class I SAM-dependent methyltransferase [Aquimarina litoralis]|uniref:class I SAM-dependent methyltransferase n=1 Tax=Aquimarina litoralis TaxID=584605 RepID=UPI001C58B51B|nr:class I SAM-dependent methyltransferase [Aquimarina litoralis]MBW1294206.1 methyltransferase domain-containing protein [Aquimarina litoralis]